VLEHVKASVLANGWVGPSCSPTLSFLDLQVSQDSLALLFAFTGTAESAELGIGELRTFHTCSRLELRYTFNLVCLAFQVIITQSK